MKPLLFLLLAVMSCKHLQAQSVGIGTNTPNSSAMLEINSSSKGVLLPRVADTTAIASPVKGLVTYNNSYNKLWYYNGGRWQPTAVTDSIWHIEAIKEQQQQVTKLLQRIQQLEERK